MTEAAGHHLWKLSQFMLSHGRPEVARQYLQVMEEHLLAEGLRPTDTLRCLVCRSCSAALTPDQVCARVQPMQRLSRAQHAAMHVHQNAKHSQHSGGSQSEGVSNALVLRCHTCRACTVVPGTSKRCKKRLRQRKAVPRHQRRPPRDSPTAYRVSLNSRDVVTPSPTTRTRRSSGGDIRLTPVSAGGGSGGGGGGGGGSSGSNRRRAKRKKAAHLSSLRGLLQAKEAKNGAAGGASTTVVTLEDFLKPV